jgi:hypothetical protein
MLASGMTMTRQNFISGGCGYQTGVSSVSVQDELERAKHALPQGLLTQFGQWDVQFRLSDNITSDCYQSLQNATANMNMRGQSSDLSQWLKACVVERSNGNMRGFDIVLKADAESIHNWLLVESFALFYYLLDHSTTVDARSNPAVSTDINAIDAARREITATFLGELSTQNRNVVGRYQNMFRSGGNLAENPKFQALVMTELSDSYFCNERTRAQNTFAGTRQQFERFAQQYLGGTSIQQRRY